MLTSSQIRRLFHALNEQLKKKNVIGEIGICGGAVMCLVFNARKATKDVDGIFQPTKEIREAAKIVARDMSLPSDWLNDAAKAFFLCDPPRHEVMSLSHLRVWAPAADYMLAMKCVSARFDSHDRDDVEFLIRYLQISTVEAILDIICQYYPRHLVPPKTQFLVEELFDRLQDRPRKRKK